MRITPVASATALVQARSATAQDVRAPVTQMPVRLLNPQPVIDPTLGIVVTEYFSHAGAMTEQFPTAKAVATYRIYGLHGDPGDVAPEKP